MSASPDRVLADADALVAAIRVHAEAMAANGDPVNVMPAINALRAAALRYVESVSSHTGWGNVFADLYEDASLPARLMRRLPGRDRSRFTG